MATTSLDDDLVPAVQDLLDELGKNVDFTVPATRTMDEETGIVTKTGETTHTVKATPFSAYKKDLIDGELIKRGDMKTLVAAQDLTFTIDQKIQGYTMTADSLTWRVITIQPIYSGESICAYKMQLRR